MLKTDGVPVLSADRSGAGSRLWLGGTGRALALASLEDAKFGILYQVRFMG